jgi:transcriptional regulator with XRE-family HTH domain
MANKGIMQKLKAWRKKNGMSQRSAVKVLNDGGVKLPLATYQKYEGGFLNPGRWALAAIERFLDDHKTVTDPPTFGRWKKPLPAEQKTEIRKLRKNGVSILSLAQKFEISESGVSRICSDKPRTRTPKTPKAVRSKFKTSPATRQKGLSVES